MKTGTLLKRWAVAFLAIVLSICLFAIPTFAEGTTEGTTDAETADESATGETEESTTGVAADEDETAEEDGEDTGSDVTTQGSTTDTGDKTRLIVWLIVGGVLVVAAVVLGIVFREKVQKFLRVYKSEVKKIVWLPWDQTKKNTLVVIVVLIICAAAICLLDFGLSKGILAFINLF